MNKIQASPKSTHTVHKLSTRDLVFAGMFAALMAAISQVSLPMPSGVPITIQVFGVALSGAVLGWKKGCLSVIVYILLGAVGLPVFAGFHGGIQSLVGMSGGYIWAWPVFVLLAGIHLNTPNRLVNIAIEIMLALVGLMIDEFFGAVQWAYLSGEKTLGAIMAYSLVVFIPKDAVITVLAVIIGRQVRRALAKVSCGSF